MSTVGWGTLSETAVNVGRPFDKASDFEEIPYAAATSDSYKQCTHAAHGMIYCRIDSKLWDLYQQHAFVMLQVRTDGFFGFPGGMAEKSEKIVAGLNRECHEEIYLDIEAFGFTADDHVISHHNQSKQLMTHFFAKEVPYDAYCTIETNTLNAEEWGIETYGIVRAPLFALGDGIRGLPVFLNNRFAGNARDQLIHTLRTRSIVPATELDKMLQEADKFAQGL